MSGSAQQEPYIFRHLTSENGLINNNVGCICQDYKGYIWIGTIDGLQRYDGNRFVNYLPDLNDPGALHAGGVSTIFEDSKHRFWVGSSAPYLLDRNTGEFYNYNLHLSGGSPVIKSVSKFIEDKKGDIWLMGANSFFKLNSKTNQFEDEKELTCLGPGSSPAILDKDNNGNVWFVTTTGICYYNPETKEVFNKHNNPGELKILDFEKRIWCFSISGNKIFFSAANSRVIYQYNFGTNSIREKEIGMPGHGQSLSKNFDVKITNMITLKNGKLLVAMAGEGLVLYDTAKNIYTEVLINNVDRNGLQSTPEMFAETNLLEDKEGNIWVGTNRGLNIFNPDKKHFYLYGSTFSKNKYDIPPYPVNGFVKDMHSEDIYLGFYYPTGGIMKVTKDFRVKKRYLYSKNGNTNLAENQIWCLYIDDDGVIWAPNQAGTILKLDTRNDQLTVMDDPALHGYINNIQKDSNGDLWLGTWNDGLKKIDHQTHRVTRFSNPPPGSSVIPKNILSFYFEGDSIIWVGTNGYGFLKFDKRVNAYTSSYLFNENDARSISSNTIVQILPYNKDTLLLSTNAGLNFFDKETGTCSRFSTKDGLPGNAVGEIQLDEKNNLWVACDGGFCKLNLKNRFVTRYGIEDGITENVFNTVPFFIMEDGTWLVSGLSGFMAFRHTDILEKKLPSAPVITGLKVLDKKLEIGSLMDAGKTVKLSYKKNNIVIEFASMQFNSPYKLRYYYRLEGVDPDWISTDMEQAAHYNQLKPGNYSFIVRSVTRDGLSSESSAALHIYIKPPYWQTWWFKIALLLLIACVLLYLVYKRRQKVAGKLLAKEKEMQMMQLKYDLTSSQLTALRTQMNPHFIFNALNSIQQYMLQGNVQEANRYLSKFSKLQRDILRFSDQNFISLENEVEILDSYLQLEQLRFGDNFTYRIDMADEVDPAEIKIPPMMLQPFAENAIWHGLMPKPGEKKLSIRFNFDTEDILLVTIEDNGIGRDASAKLKQINGRSNIRHDSKGMALINQRLQLLQQQYEKPFEIVISDIPGINGLVNGTRVLLKMFIGKNNYG